MKRILSLLLLAVCATIVCAKEPKEPTSYNYQRGVEAAQNNNDEEAERYLRQELESNPKNGYAYAWLSGVVARRGETGQVIAMLEKAIKYMPKSDKYYHAWANSRLCDIYEQFGDTTRAIEYASRAIKAQPKNIQWWQDRGQLYMAYKQYELALADFRQMIQVDATCIEGYVLLGNAYYAMKQYGKSLEQYEYANRLGVRSYTYGYMAQTYTTTKQYDKAAECVVKAFELRHHDDRAVDVLFAGDKQLNETLLPHFKVQVLKNPNSVEWRSYLYAVYYYLEEYECAIEQLWKMKELEAHPYIDLFLAGTYRDMGDFSSALQYAQLAYATDTTDYGNLRLMVGIYDRLDSLHQCIHFASSNIALHPDSSALYDGRGWYYFLVKDYPSALEDYNTAIALDGANTYARYMRGRIRNIMGDSVNARKDFQDVLVRNDDEMAKLFSLIYMDCKAEARHLADSICATDTIHYDNYYDLACAYSLLGETELAFSTLEKTLEEGYNNFSHLRRDIDFEPIRGERLDSLLAIYETKVQERISAFKGEETNLSCNERVVEIPFSKAGGVTKVDCTINELPLSFIFDTGASDVTISQVEANFMYKNGYLSNKDVVGKQRYQTADGSISVGTTIILKEVQFAGLVLKNVRASVVKSQNAPLLLGQSVLQRLGKIEIDNSQRILKITTKQ
jgi:clan AA aspartic protease (TIGR02281 family)